MKNSNAYPLFIMIAAFCWGISGIFTKVITRHGFTPMEMGFIKTFIAMLILMVYFSKKGKGVYKLKKKADLKDFITISIFGYSLYSVAYIFTVNEIGVGLAGAMLYTKTGLVLVFSSFVFGKKITLKSLLIIMLTILGCLCISGVFSPQQVSITFKGIAWGVASGIGFAIYDVFGKRSLDKYSSETVTLYTFIIATILMGILANPITTIVKIFQMNTLPFMILYAMVVSVVPYLLYAKGLSKVDVSVAAVISTFELMVASVAGIVLYNESITFLKIVGILFMISSVCVLSISSSNKAAKRTNVGEIEYD
ncbi:DMT family transporter [Anaerotignum sp.]|uniref:DMT family transporter n=1 Tax=Anaerotignum sp. TaxID=2039241 RepID=UPI00331A819C